MRGVSWGKTEGMMGDKQREVWQTWGREQRWYGKKTKKQCVGGLTEAVCTQTE